MASTDIPTGARGKLLEASLAVIRGKGYSATTVDDICQAAGVTKGAFFHHFKTKEDLAIAAADHWSTMTGALFDAAPYRALPDPLDRLLGYVDFRKAILRGELPEYTCLVGTMVQETFVTYPAIRDACEASIVGHAKVLEADIAEAMRERGVAAEWTAESLALHTQVVIQGALLLAKATGGPKVAVESLDHLRRYLEMLFKHPQGGSET